jgi:uncharacterized protein YukE
MAVTTSTSGAGILDSYSSLVQSIQDGSQSEGQKVCGVAVDAAGAISDTVSFAMDPLAGILTAGVGWLFEHVQFLREPLDALMGDPDEIQQNVDQLKAQAANLAQLADQHNQDQQAVKPGWSGDAGDAFHSSMDRLGGELASLGKTVEGSASVVAMSGALVTTLRGIVLDLISSLIAELIEGALVAAATAVITFGASIAGFIGYAVGRAAALGAKIAGQIAKLVSGLARQGSRLSQLGDAMGRLSKSLDRFSQAAGVGQNIAGAVAPGQPDGGVTGGGSGDEPQSSPRQVNEGPADAPALEGHGPVVAQGPVVTGGADAQASPMMVGERAAGPAFAGTLSDAGPEAEA